MDLKRKTNDEGYEEDVKRQKTEDNVDEGNSETETKAELNITPNYPYRYLYRVIRDDENPCRDGIRAKQPNAMVSVEDHVRIGSTAGQKSQYISTSAVSDDARRFRNLKLGKNKKKRRFRKRYIPLPNIVEIDCEGLNGVTYIDLTKEENRQVHLSSDVSKRYAYTFSEVLIIGFVPAKHCKV